MTLLLLILLVVVVLAIAGSVPTVRRSLPRRRVIETVYEDDPVVVEEHVDPAPRRVRRID